MVNNPKRRTKGAERQIQEGSVPLKQMAQFGLESLPGVGEAIIAKDIAQDVKDEQYLSAGLNTLALGVGAIPGAGDILNRPIRAAAKKLRKQDSDVATKMLNDIDSIETWKKQNPNPKPQKQNPNIEKAANDLLEGKITGKQYRSVVKENMPIQKIEEVPEVPSFTEIVGALDKDKSAKGIIGLNKKIKDGTRVSSRLDIPAYERFDKWVVSVHDAFDKKGRESLSGDIIGYGKTAVLKNVEFKGSPTGAASISARKTDKGTIARIFGDYINAEPENVEEYARQVIKDKEWTQVGYNPFRHGFFYDKDTGMPVKSAEEVVQVGPLVLAKNAQKIKISEAKQVGPKGGLKIRTGKPIEGLEKLRETKTVFNKGGAVPMNTMAKQMELFEPVERAFDEGGLMDEGGTVDPVSGNEVPPGSTQEEVRDDVPAQLSEGEFVFPADVVRYIGLETLMRMRQEAKMGLAQMEAMGQMGNSEEAIIPDDLPFDMYDLDIEDDGLEMQVGGVVPAPMSTAMGTTTTGGSFNPQTNQFVPSPVSVPAPVGTAATPIRAASDTRSPTDPNLSGTKFTPTSLQTVMPTFQQTIGGGVINVDYELVEFINDAGQIILLKVDKKTGEVLDPIPEGFYKKTEKDEKKVTPDTTLGTGVQTAKVLDQGGGDDSTGMDGDTPGGVFGGNPNTSKSSAYSKAVRSLGLAQITSLNPVMAIVNTLTGNPTANNLATAANKARNAAVTALGLPNIGAASVSQLDSIGSAMNVVSNFSKMGQIGIGKGALTGEDISESVAAAIAEAVDSGKMSEEQAEALSEMSQDSVTGALVGKDGKTGAEMSQDDIDAITAYAQAIIDSDPAMQDDEDEGPSAPSAPSAPSGTPGDPGDPAAQTGIGEGPGGAPEGTGPSGTPGTPGDPGDPASQTGIGAGPGGAPDGPDGGCFAAGTKFFMHDGSLKFVEDIKVGDVMMDGGKVRLSIIGDGSNSDWYMYGATKVTGSHAVKEQGVWKFTRDTENAVPAETEDLLYTIVNTNHRMVAEDKVVYADYDMVDEDGIEEELLEMMNLQEVVKEAA